MNARLARPTRRHASPHRQRGVAAVFAGIAMLTLIPVMALTIDIGQLYYAQRDLQKLATVAALDAARAESGCYLGGDGTPGSLAAATTAVRAAMTANGVADPASVMQAIPGAATVEFGHFDNKATPGTRIFTVLSQTDPGADAVRVNLAALRPTPLMPFIFAPDQTTPGAALLVASASAQHAPMASFRVLSTLADLDTSNSSLLDPLLSGMVGGKVTLNAAGYRGLANTQISLDQISATLGISDPNTLLSQDLPLPTALKALATALASAGQTEAAAALDQIAAVADPNRKTTLGDALGIENGVENLVGALPINTVDLLNSLAMSAAHGLYPITLAPIVTNVAGLSLNAYLNVLDPGQLSKLGRPGYDSAGLLRTKAHTEQITLLLRASYVLPGIATLKLGTDVDVAAATAALTGIRCPAGVGPLASTQPTALLDISTDIATVTVGSFNTSNPAVPVTAGSLLAAGVPGVLGLQVNALSKIGPASVGTNGGERISLAGPYPKEATVGSRVQVGSTVGSLVSALNVNVCANIVLLGLVCVPISTDPNSLPLATRLVLGPVLTSVQNALNKTLAPILNSTIDNLAAALGLRIGEGTARIESAANLQYGNGSDGAQPGTLASTSVPTLFTQAKATPAAASPATR